MSYWPGLANISITYNGQDYTTTVLQYVYYRQAILLDISPWLGPVTGGTLVTVRVEGAVTPLGLENSACRFGEIVVRPENLSGTAISCRAPLVFVSQPALLALTLNLADYVSRSNVKYLFYNEPVVGAITPTGGSIHGNTTVVATGGLFKVSPDQLVIYCVFGSVRVQSVLFDKAQVSCQSPSAPVGEWSKGPIKFAVSLNGVDLGTKFDYVYHGSNVNLALGFRDVSVDFFTPSKIDDLRTTILEEAPDWISAAKVREWDQHPDHVVVGGRLSSACYIPDAFPAALFLAWRHAGDFAAGVCANARVGGDNCHRGAVVGSLLGASAPIPDRYVAGLQAGDRVEGLFPKCSEEVSA